MARVLYVDDNPLNIRLMEAVFDLHQDFELATATRGREALEMLTTNDVDLVLLDLRLPDIQGERVLEEMGRDAATASIPTIVVSADDDRRSAQQLINMGATAYVSKPFEMDRFIELVEKTLEQNSKAE
jgi:CheY-like chemotaxis protein